MSQKPTKSVVTWLPRFGCSMAVEHLFEPRKPKIIVRTASGRVKDGSRMFADLYVVNPARLNPRGSLVDEGGRQCLTRSAYASTNRYLFTFSILDRLSTLF